MELNLMATSVNINNDLMVKLQAESDKTGLNVDELVAKYLSDNLDIDDNVINVRKLSHNQMRNEVVDFMKKHDIADALEISDALMLDVFEVNEIMVELIKEGVLEEL